MTSQDSFILDESDSPHEGDGPPLFGQVVDLLEALEHLQTGGSATNELRGKQKHIIETWFARHQKSIHVSDSTRIALLSTLLPSHRVDRVYGLGHTRLAHLFARCLRLGHARASQLHKWQSTDVESFPSLVARLQDATEAGTPTIEPTLEEVDQALNTLAGLFHFSSPELRKSCTGISKDDVFATLCSRMKAKQLRWFVHLLLKDLASQVVLEDKLVLHAFHSLLPGILKLQAHIPDAMRLLRVLETSSLCQDQGEHVLSQEVISNHLGTGRVGHMVPIQPYAKARSIKHCLQLMDGAKGRWSLQTKFDGEYCQVHVDLSGDPLDYIKIFSKSRKDSTEDKAAVHGFLRDCLRVGLSGCGIKQNCILEGELLVYNRETSSIMPFHKIRQHVTRAGRHLGTAADGAVDPNEMLIIVFFDIISLDNELLLS